MKTLNFSANDDRTFLGCTSGITPFAVPWRSADAVNQDLVDERCFSEATLKSPADIKKHAMGTTFDAPTSLQGLVRVLTNYSRLLEVIFGCECPHLILVLQLQDGLDLHERILDNRVTPTLMINLLWKVHQDSRQFFNHCEKWETGEVLPRSNLRNTVSALIDDIDLSTTITCPVSDFLGTPGAAPKREARDPKREAGVGGGHGKQATKNSSIPPLCATVVREYNRLYPTLDISTFVRKAGIRYMDVKVGTKGDCTNFGLLGRCSETCTYRHRVITVPDDRARTIKTALEDGLAKLAAAPKSA